MAAFGHLADNSGWLAGNDAETWYDHVWGYNGAFEDTDVVFNDRKFANDDVLADVDVAADGCCLDDGALADKNVVA